jgi:23S rRNA (pseudouridine1915-N3)-methyltransferase
MRIDIVAVGLRQPDWADQAVQDYLARFPRDFEVTLREVRPEPRGQQPVERILKAEAERLQQACSAATCVVALDERGADWTTERLARQLGQWRDAAEHVAFVIGGPDGLCDSVRSAARMQLRLSSMTLPHALARVVLAEQMYRVWSILANHPYHRA